MHKKMGNFETNNNWKSSYKQPLRVQNNYILFNYQNIILELGRLTCSINTVKGK